jgi:two-component system, cell cycle sensor histidine kinase and response regulator CckA
MEDLMKILAIDDNRDNLTTLKAILHDAFPDGEVLTAQNGPTGIELALAEDPDVILLDIVMPGMDGFEVCRKLKQDDAVKHIPVVFLTALKTDRKSRLKALETGADAFLAKPIDEVELIAQIRAMIRIKAAYMREQNEKDRLAALVAARTQQLVKELKERRQAEKALRESERKFRAITEQTSDLVALTDQDGMIVYASSAAQKIFLCSPKEMCGRHFREFLHESVVPGALSAFHATMTTKRASKYLQLQMRRKDGSVFTGELNASHFQTGTEDGALVVIRDISERIQAEDALRQSEAKLRAMFNAAPLSIVMLDRHGTVLDSNDEHAARLQLRRGEITGMCIWDVTPPSVLEERRCRVKEVFETGRPFSGEDRRGEVWNEYYLHPAMWNERGEVTAVLVVAILVTDRKKAEEALRESEEATRSLMNATMDAAFMVDLSGTILTANEEIAKRFDRSEADMIGACIWDVLPSDVSENRKAMVAEVVRTGKMVRFEDERDGRFFHNSLHPVFDANGKVSKVAVFGRDITEQKEAEANLREREAWLRAASESSLDSFFIFEAERDDAGEVIDFVFVYVNRTAEEMLQMPRETLLGKRMCEVLPINREAGFFERYKRVLETGIPLEEEFLLPNTHVPSAWYYHQVLPLPDGIAISHRDITERKQAEEEREKLHAQFLQAQKMESVGRLAGGVAHDFNNKLTVILGNTQMAMENLDRSDPVYGELQDVLDAGKQSTDIVRQLLAFARKQIIAPEVLDLNESLEGMLKMLRRLIGEDIELAWEPAANLWQVNMDPTQIDQILANLCVNARDAISGVGKVTIETENRVLDESYCADHTGFLPGEYVMLVVSDDGCGMDKETLANAFEPFFTTKETGKGTGLGLSTVYGIVKQNQGFVNIYSEPGKGTSFKIYLPRHAGEAEEGIHEVQTEAPRGCGETILVVEDETSVLHLARRVLEHLGYAVLTSATPAEAVAMVREYDGEIHLLMTDVVLPGMSGKDLAGEMMQIRPNIRTLFMSGYTANVIAHQGVLEKGVQFLGKPFTPDSLARKVREALGSEK